MDRSYNNQCNAITNSARASCNIVNSPHTSRKAFHQCPHPCRPNCWLTLANSLMQFGQMGRRAIHVSDPDWNLIPDMIYLVHVWTHNRPVHEINIMSVLKCHRVARYIRRGIVLHRHKDPSEEPSRPCDSSECRCSDACSSFHPGWSRCSPLPRCPPFLWVGWMQASTSLSPWLRRTRALSLLWHRENTDSSLKMQCLLWWRS